MALFNKFFQSHRRKNRNTTKQQQQLTQSQGSHESLFPFSCDQVRVLLFRECDWSGRRLLFDSSAVQKVSVSSPNQRMNKLNANNENHGDKNTSHAFIDVRNGYGYIYNQSANDSNNIGEMVFGSVAMSFKGTSLKVHWLQDPKRILCSQVFLSPLPSKFSFCRSTSTDGSTSSMNCDSTKSSQSNEHSAHSIALSLSVCVADKLPNESNENARSNSTIPLDVPSSLECSSFAFSGCDSGYSGTDLWTTSSNSSYQRSNRSSVGSMFSTDPSIVSSRKLSIDSAILVDAALNGRPSDGCLQRRILRNMSTSFENHLSRNDFIGYFDENQMLGERTNVSIPNSMVRRHSEHCGESVSNPELVRKRKNASKNSLKPPHLHFSSYTPQRKISQRRSKIGLAVCIQFSESVEEEMQLFCSEHIALLESMLCRLRAAAELAYGNQKKFHQLMLHAWIATSSWITDLFTAPRINEPVWLSLSSGFTERPNNNLAKHFMTELCWLLNSADTKDTNFFISTLLTAILTNHLGWVATVVPFIHSSPYENKAAAIQQNQAKLMEISKFHPYNVLWAQLSDLYGSIGSPSKLAKTIISGAHTITINKVLNVLTYFVRCGDIERVNSTQILDKNDIEEIIMNRNHREKVSALNSNSVQNVQKGLIRTKTCLKNVSSMNNETSADSSTMLSQNGSACAIQSNGSIRSTIKLMVTSPNDDKFEYETASEALDFVLKKVKSEPEDFAEPNQEPMETADKCENKSASSLWSIDTVTDGIAIDIWKPTNLHSCLPSIETNVEMKRTQSLNNKLTNRLKKSRTLRTIANKENENDEITKTFSDLISNQLKYERKPLQYSLTADANYTEMPRMNQQGKDEMDHLDPSANVVFVLGENDVLSGLRTPPPSPNLSVKYNVEANNQKPVDEVETSTPKPKTSIQIENEAASFSKTASTSPAPTKTPEKKKKHCTHKKHSGVKFNFEQYPQIVTNYMKNKNLDIASYDFLEKGLKLEQENAFNYGASSSVLPKLPEDIQEQDEQEEEEQCECCANTFRILQTPSNATELEFSNEDGSYPVPISKPIKTEPSPAIEMDKASSNDDNIQQNKTELLPSIAEISTEPQKKHDANSQVTNATNETKYKVAVKHLELIKLPVPKTEIVNDTKNRRRLRAGYVPSLFVGITDHFIPDMVLQGITAPLTQWEPILKQNLTLSSHCATFEQMPTENVAIIANVDKWDVKLVSSQSYSLLSGAFNGPIGMSQLVSTMLETVHAMWLAGTSPHQCMSFMESKLKEIYLQSKALAAFLLATEFCSLNTVTTALNLSANDVPLLLSVASIHSPQVTKKYGISFR